MLQVEQLDIHYGSAHAVRSVDLDVGTGEALALLGPNGAGKSSTLRAISGLTPYGGVIRFDGVDLASMSVNQRALAGIIHVPEGRRVFADLTVHENLVIGRTAANGRTAFSYDDVYSLFPALARLRKRLGFALSGGEQQMVALGRALVGAPRLLMVDEPSLGLAPLVASNVTDALLEIKSRTSLLVVEQNVHLALKICSRAIVLRAGEVVLRATSDELDDRDALLSKYLGQSDIVAAAAAVEASATA
jgi:branched-chain amino acid transport system ATP-binding protein